MLLHSSCQYLKGAKESLGQAESSLSAAKHLTKRLPHSNGQRTREGTQELSFQGLWGHTHHSSGPSGKQEQKDDLKIPPEIIHRNVSYIPLRPWSSVQALESRLPNLQMQPLFKKISSHWICCSYPALHNTLSWWSKFSPIFCYNCWFWQPLIFESMN